jgi:hypothetical protein
VPSKKIRSDHNFLNLTERQIITVEIGERQYVMAFVMLLQLIAQSLIGAIYLAY